MISIPFPGNKRYSYKRVREIFTQGGYTAVYEPFGGSCVLSVNLTRDGLARRAVVNDYDHFFDDYGEYLDEKDRIVAACFRRGVRKRLKSGERGRVYSIIDGDRRIPVETTMLEPWEAAILQEEVAKADRRLWKHLDASTNFTYGGYHKPSEVGLGTFKYFQNELTTDRQRKFLGILSECETPHLDWRDFFKTYEPEMDGGSLVILDPPYVGTEQQMYKGGFTIEDTEELIGRVVETGVDFIFFNHNPDYVASLLNGLNPAIELTGNVRSTANHNRLDVMAYVRRGPRPHTA